MINKELAKKRGLSEETVGRIEQLHELFEHILLLEEGDGTHWTNYEVLLPHLTLLESQLQELWGFPVDKRYHHYSFRLKGCSCPYEDNMERLGSGLFIINKKCIVHGSKTNE